MNEPSEKDSTPEENSVPIEENSAVEGEKKQEEEEKIEEEKEIVGEIDRKLQPEESVTEVHVEELKNTLSLLFDLQLLVSIELARKEMLVGDILRLGEGSLIEFDKAAGETVDLLVNNKKIAEGEVVVIEDRFGIRITNLVNPGERIKNLSK